MKKSYPAKGIVLKALHGDQQAIRVLGKYGYSPLQAAQELAQGASNGQEQAAIQQAIDAAMKHDGITKDDLGLIGVKRFNRAAHPPRKQPKYLLAEHEGREWVVRTRNPFVVAEIVRISDGSIGARIAFQQLEQHDPHCSSLGGGQCDCVALIEHTCDAKLLDSILRWYHHAKGWPYGRAPK